MNEITKRLLENEAIKKYLEKLKISPITILGLSDVSKSYIPAIIETQRKKQICLITYNELQAQRIYKDIKCMNEKVVFIPKKDIITYKYDAQNMDLLEKEKQLIELQAKLQELSKEYNIEEIKEKLIQMGYERFDLVEGKGTFSIRGDILDVAVDNKKGIRIEFFGDEVDQIRYFEISSQRSTETIKSIEIYPMTEEIINEPNGNILEYLQNNSTVIFDEKNKIELRGNNILENNSLAINDLIERNKEVPYILSNMYDMEKILNLTSKFKIVELESQDIDINGENTLAFEHKDIKILDSLFLELTKQKEQEKQYKPRKRLSNDFKEGEKVGLDDLKIGDYVVHRTIGIGQYLGVNTIKADGIVKDYIKIKYRGDDTLYIPTNSLDNIRKYIGGGEKAPKLNKLGSKEWENTKNRVKSNLREVARNLIELYATRQNIQGFAFEKDTPWQKEFEDTFPYQETEDQLRCIKEVKEDMEKPKPMDRLLCRRCRIWKNRSCNKSSI